MSFLGSVFKIARKALGPVLKSVPVVGTAYRVAETFLSPNDRKLPGGSSALEQQFAAGAESSSATEVRRIYARWGITPNDQTVLQWSPNVGNLEATLRQDMGNPVMPGGAPIGGGGGGGGKRRAGKRRAKEAGRKRGRAKKLKFGSKAYRAKYLGHK